MAATGGEEKPEWHADAVPGPLDLEGLIITRPNWASNDDGSNDSIIDHVVVDIFKSFLKQPDEDSHGESRKQRLKDRTMKRMIII